MIEPEERRRPSTRSVRSAMTDSFLYAATDGRSFEAATKAVEAAYAYVESVGGADMLDRIRSAEELFVHSVSTAGGTALMYSGRPEEEKTEAVACALLHDVGKTFVDQAVLYKKSPLTREEFDKIKEHSHRGAAFIALLYSRKSRFYERVALTALYHHERPKHYSFLPNLSSIPGSDILPKSIDQCDAGTSALLDAVSIADSLSAVCDARSYKPAEPERMPGLLIELKNMCGKCYLQESVSFVSAVETNVGKRTERKNLFASGLEFQVSPSY